MKKQEFYLVFIFIVFSASSFSQEFQIGTPVLEFDGRKLQISYDLLPSRKSDKFYVWVEVLKKSGDTLKMKSANGDFGDTKPGEHKIISWMPANDSVFLNEMVTVEVKAEKYVRSFNKCNMMLLSALVPGLGQTKTSKGKPYWLTGVASYGTLAAGLVFRSSYSKTFDKYLDEEDPLKRADYHEQAQMQLNISNTLLVSAAAIWTVNLFWVALTPNRYQQLKYTRLTVAPSADPLTGTTLLTMRFKF